MSETRDLPPILPRRNWSDERIQRDLQEASELLARQEERHEQQVRSRRNRLQALGFSVAFLALSGCGASPPVETVPTPTPTPAVTAQASPRPAPSAAPSLAPSPSPSPSPLARNSPAPRPSARPAPTPRSKQNLSPPPSPPPPYDSPAAVYGPPPDFDRDFHDPQIFRQ